jgi:hypothetical protein
VLQGTCSCRVIEFQDLRPIRTRRRPTVVCAYLPSAVIRIEDSRRRHVDPCLQLFLEDPRESHLGLLQLLATTNPRLRPVDAYWRSVCICKRDRAPAQVPRHALHANLRTRIPARPLSPRSVRIFRRTLHDGGLGAAQMREPHFALRSASLAVNASSICKLRPRILSGSALENQLGH